MTAEAPSSEAAWVRRLASSLGVAAVLAGVSALPAHATPGIVFATGGDSDAVAVLKADAAGALTPIGGSPFDTGDKPYGVVATPDARHVYVANTIGNEVSAYSVGANGALTPVPGQPFETGSGSRSPFGLAVAPNGGALYVTNFSTSELVRFKIGPNGALSSMTTGSTDGSPEGVAVTPDGKYVYTANTAGTISAFSVGDAGVLTAVPDEPFAAGSLPSQVAITPDGQLLLVSNNADAGEAVRTFKIDTDGSLDEVVGSPFGGGVGTVGVAVSPNGKFAYATHSEDSNVSAYSITAAGGLSALDDSPFAAGAGPDAVALSPGGRRAYVTNAGGDNISAYVVGADGVLDELPDSPFMSGVEDPSLQSVATLPDQGPIASFKGTTGKGLAVRLDGTASRDTDGLVARYAWDFGDGETTTGGDPKPTHTYPSPGIYTVKLTVTDDAGCSTIRTFTGQTASCNGSFVATATRTVDAFPGVVLATTSAKVNDGKVRVKVTCPAGSSPPCQGKVKLFVVRKKKPKRRLVGEGAYTIQPGSTKKVKVTLTKAGKELFNKKGQLNTRIRAKVTDGFGTSKTATGPLTLQ